MTLQADAVTASLPIVLCARQDRQAVQKPHLRDRQVRLLLVPFTPEELVAAVDKAIAELG